MLLLVRSPVHLRSVTAVCARSDCVLSLIVSVKCAASCLTLSGDSEVGEGVHLEAAAPTSLISLQLVRDGAVMVAMCTERYFNTVLRLLLKG